MVRPNASEVGPACHRDRSRGRPARSAAPSSWPFGPPLRCSESRLEVTCASSRPTRVESPCGGSCRPVPWGRASVVPSHRGDPSRAPKSPLRLDPPASVDLDPSPRLPRPRGRDLPRPRGSVRPRPFGIGPPRPSGFARPGFRRARSVLGLWALAGLHLPVPIDLGPVVSVDPDPMAWGSHCLVALVEPNRSASALLGLPASSAPGSEEPGPFSAFQRRLTQTSWLWLPQTSWPRLTSAARLWSTPTVRCRPSSAFRLRPSRVPKSPVRSRPSSVG
jgi:hypothetical protein